MKLTIYFDGQFWVGVVEDLYEDHIIAARHVFGAEPQDADVLAFVNQAIPAILDLPAAPDATPLVAPAPTKINPKRRARLVAAELRATGITTKAQQALQAEYEARQQESQVKTHAQRAAALAHKRARQREHAKERHRGH